VPRYTPKADTMIVLWMAGGQAHTETFDPKPYTPFEKGMDARGVASTFPSIPTAVDGIRFSEGLEHTAEVMDRGALIRTFNAGDLGFILHSRHQYHWHTGYEPPLTVAAPHIGAWTAHARGPLHDAVPPFIDIGQRYQGNGEAEELKAFQTGGILDWKASVEGDPVWDPAGIDVPTTVFYGSEDDLADRQGSLAYYDRLTVRSEYVELSGVDHYMMHGDRRAEVFDLVHDIQDRAVSAGR